MPIAFKQNSRSYVFNDTIPYSKQKFNFYVSAVESDLIYVQAVHDPIQPKTFSGRILTDGSL